MKMKLALGAAVVALWIGAGSAQAQLPVTDATVIANQKLDFIQQLKDFAQQLKSYETQLQQYAQEIQMYQNMVTNTISLPESIYWDVQSKVSAIRGIFGQASLLSGNAGNIIGRLNSLNGTAYTLGSTTDMFNDMPNKFTQWQNTLGNAAQTLGNGLEEQQNQLAELRDTQGQIKDQAMNADGQKEVLQGIVQMTANNGSTLQQMQQTMLAAAQTEANQVIVTEDRRALHEAAVNQFLLGDDIAQTGQGW